MVVYKEVFLGLGGNIGDTRMILESTLEEIAAIPGTIEVTSSSFYKTAPVSDIPQDDYINAVCRCKTTLSVREFSEQLRRIETQHGKMVKPKNYPRTIDIDILFFGNETYCKHDLEIPHPRWKERLFVLVPLKDLVDTIAIGQDVFDVAKMIEAFPRAEREFNIEEIYAPHSN